MTGWALAALALHAVWLVAAFGARTLIQRRRTGDSGLRGLSGTPGSAAWWTGCSSSWRDLPYAEHGPDGAMPARLP